MNDYDKGARFAARMLDPEGFFRWLMGALFWQAWRWRDWLDTQAVPLPGGTDRRSDTVAGFDRRDGSAPPAAVVVEFMTRPRGDVFERLAEYALLVRRELPYQRDPLVPYDVAGVLVNLTGESTADKWTMAPAECGGAALSFRPHVVNVAKLDAAATLAEIAAGGQGLCVLAWVSLTQGGDNSATIAEWKRLALLEPNSQKRRYYAGIALIFAGLTGCIDMWKKELEGWDVERSPITLDWEAAERVRTKQEDLVAILRIRFKQEPPADITEAITRQPDVTVLGAWLQHAVEAPTFDDLRPLLGL